MAENDNSTRGWFVYRIRTRRGSLYTGITVDLSRRWKEHCEGKAGAKFFRSDPPSALCFAERWPDRGSASRREAAIKKLNAKQKRLLVRCQGPLAI